MTSDKIDEIKKFLEQEEKEIHHLESSINKINRKIIDSTPAKFCSKDIARSFFAALFITFGFVLKGAMVRTAVRLQPLHVFAIIAVSLLILILEVHYFGYRKVPNKDNRKYFQFFAKRVPTFYLVSLFVSTLLVFIYGINNDVLVTSHIDVIKIIVAISFPASLGAGIGDLMKKYQV